MTMSSGSRDMWGISAPPADVLADGRDDRRAWADEPCYVISVAARMVGMHAQTLRAYERAGLVLPARSKGNIRLYRRSDIDRLRLIQRLMTELGVNLAGVEVILRLDARVRTLEGEVEHLVRQLRQERQSVAAGESPPSLESASSLEKTAPGQGVGSSPERPA